MHESKVSVIVVLALLHVAGASATPTPDSNARAHPPIVIVGDAGFLLPGSGVRSGSGTETDPYVIAHWTIVQPTAITGALGIVLMGTSAHVLVKDVDVLGPACEVECPFYEAVRIEGTRNVVLEDVRVHHFEIGFTILDSHDIAVDEFLHRGGPNPRFFGDANRVLNSTGVSLAGLHTESLGWRNLLIQDSTRIAVEGARFGPSAYPNWDAGTITVARSTDVAFRASEFRGADLTLGHGVNNLAVEHNAFIDGGQVYAWSSESTSVHGALAFCGNLFASASDPAMDIQGATSVLVKGNDFQNNTWHARIQLHGLEPVPDTPFSRIVLTGSILLENNRFGDASWGGATISAANVTAAGNLFEGANAWLALRADNGSAVGNWWGHPSGPSGAGAGDGNRYAPYGTNLAHEPWLDEAPAFERVGCEG